MQIEVKYDLHGNICKMSVGWGPNFTPDVACIP